MSRTVKHAPGEIVVKLKDSNRAHVAAAIEAIRSRLGRSSVVRIHSLLTDATVQVVRISKDTQLRAAIEALKGSPSVEIAEPNFIYHAFNDGAPLDLDVPNDPDFGKTWGLKNTGQADESGQIGIAGADIGVTQLWQEGIRGSRQVVVAVIDTGVDWDHPDLKDNIYTNPGEAGADAKPDQDNDGNGFVYDIHGWNFSAKNNNSRDDHDHGSHCSGTIGAVGNNGVGVAGVNWEVSLLPIKFLDAEGSGSLETAVEAINYATMMKANVMSNSWGGGGVSDTMKAAIAKARDAGILFVAAAGNDSSDNDSMPTYPASYDLDNIVSVAATDNRDTIASFSNYGSKTVHVAAPGVNVYSTVKGGLYDKMSGTSMAAPHISGIAALLWSALPDLSYTELKQRLIATSDPVQGLKRKVAARGRVNVYNALHNIVPVTHDPDPSLWKTEKFAAESSHPYKDNADTQIKVFRSGAKFIRVHFEKVEVEANYDKIYIQTPDGQVSDEITGSASDLMSEYVVGETAVIRLKADDSNTAYGYKVDRIQVIY